jgi:hypothetical protein
MEIFDPKECHRVNSMSTSKQLMMPIHEISRLLEYDIVRWRALLIRSRYYWLFHDDQCSRNITKRPSVFKNDDTT